MCSTERTVTGGDVWRQAIAGVLLMAGGVVLLLDQFGVIEIGSMWRWWPLVLVAMGLWKISAPGVKRDVGGGLELMIFGAWILACTRHWMGLTFMNSWPLVFVGIGVKMVVKSMAPARPPAPKNEKGEGHA
ncbi:MAG: LiaI-LiaF-like domain-containing protein [Candidatus Eiseniibacteriota bacterium]